MGEGEMGLEEVEGGTDPLSMSLAALSAVEEASDPLSSSFAGLTAEPEELLSNLVASLSSLPRPALAPSHLDSARRLRGRSLLPACSHG
jgi:hypothetical protein